MYNEERKLSYLSTKGGSNKPYISMFNGFSAEEEASGLDVCEFSSEQLERCFSANFLAKLWSIKSVIRFLKGYAAWCKEQGYATSNGLYEVDLDKIETKQTAEPYMVGSAGKLSQLLDIAFDPVSKNSGDCLPRCYVWLAFSGVPKEESLSILSSQVDLVNMEIISNGKAYPIYREAASVFYQARDSRQFFYEHPKYPPSFRDRKESPYLFRGIRTERATHGGIELLVREKTDVNGLKFAYNRVRQCGLFCRAYEMESMGFGLSLLDSFIEEEIRAREAKNSTSVRGRKFIIRNDIYADYRSWKKNFRVPVEF